MEYLIKWIPAAKGLDEGNVRGKGAAIKAVRYLFNLELKEAKEFVDRGCIRDGTRLGAEHVCKALNDTSTLISPGDRSEVGTFTAEPYCSAEPVRYSLSVQQKWTGHAVGPLNDHP